jgi:hypothetical protein
VNLRTAAADLIVRGLNGQHLHGFLPGNDNKAAISRAVASKHGWSGPGSGWSQVGPDGIGEWPYLGGTSARVVRRRRDAVLFVTWQEVLDVIARGCSDGYRARYEAAHAAWGAACAAWQDCKPGPSAPVPWVDQGGINETGDALIRHGCEPPGVAPDVLVQGELFEIAAVLG